MEKPWYSFLYIKSPIAKIIWGIVSVVVSFVAILALFIMEEERMAAQTGNWEGRSIEKGADIYANNCFTCHGDNGQGGAGPALNSRYFFEHRLEDLGFAGSMEDFVELTVAGGRPSNAHGQFAVVMPTWSNRFGGPLRDDQVQQVTDFVLNWESTALLQTPEEDPFIPFANVGQPVTGTTTVSGTVAMGSRTPEQLFNDPAPQGMGCYACHNLNAADTAVKVGPSLATLPEVAGTRVPGEDANTYVHTSIVSPDAYIVESYPASIMPKTFATSMTPEELDALVTWLLDPSRTAQ